MSKLEGECSVADFDKDELELVERPELPDRAEVAFHPPFLLLGAIAAGFAVRWFAPLAFLPGAVSRYAGPALFAAAFGLFFWAVFTMRRGGASIPTGEPTSTIVVGGPYRFSRNPIYLAMVLLQCAIGIWANSLWFLGLAPLSAIILWWGVISREERYLERKFGADYNGYQARVRRWL